MKRSGPLNGIERWPAANPGYSVAVHFNVDGSVRPFTVRFYSHRQLLSFTPEPFSLSNMSQGLGYDTVKDPKTRARCIAAVNELNRHLHWTWYGHAAIQRVGPDFIVTYETVSAAAQKKAHYMYMDPYVSFMVTPKGTVFAAFFGA